MKLPITITQQGLQALVDAEAGTTNKVTIAELGLSNTTFIMAPTLTDLPGEFKRISSVAGESVSETVVHLVATDDLPETYVVQGVGLFLDNGVLFGVYSQKPEDGPLFEKSEAATFLFAVDITFSAGQAAFIQFGDANFIYPPASETVKGVAYLATQDEVNAGTEPEKIVTPKTLAGKLGALAYIPIAQKGAANGVATLDATGKVPPSQLPAVDSIDTYTVASQAEMLALPAGPGDFALRTDLNKTYVLRAAPATTLSNWAEFLSPGAPVRSVQGRIGDVVISNDDVGAPPKARAITGGGLVQGGGDLNADRVLQVLIATAAEALAGARNDVALTPASLAQILASLAGKVALGRRIDTAGLAQGGGDLNADRTITVPKGTAADVESLWRDDVAVTPAALAGTLRSIQPNGYLRIPGTPLIIQWGNATMPAQNFGTQKVVTFPIAFPSGCFQVQYTSTFNLDSGDEADETPWIRNYAPTNFIIENRGDWPTFTFSWIALGV
jgi:hypothetical protein